MRLLAVALFAPCLGCNAIFGVEPGTFDKGEVHIQGEHFEFTLHVTGNGVSGFTSKDVAADLTHAFALDVDEVTVARFRAWQKAAFTLPAEGDSLDPGGPYENAMRWSSDFMPDAAASDFRTPHCDPAERYPGVTTFAIGTGDLPMTCVTWAQAVAFCAFEKKRLPTLLEWQFAAQGGAARDLRPFAGPIDCAHVTFSGCGFPKAIGTAIGKTQSGVLDMGGSVTEWIWDKTDGTTPLASSLSDGYAGAAAGNFHYLRGGEYWWSADQIADQNEHAFAGDMSAVSDVGFRCARTILPPD